jgi:hypothetical protein
MSVAVAAAMADLGYDRYVVSAGDVGCDVAEALAARHPDRVAALHLTDVFQYRFLVDPPQDLTADERAYVERGHAWQAAEGGYMHEQSTKPHTLAVALGDSPAGQAAWILEKLRTWTDRGATWKPCSRATSCSRGSPHTGSAGRSAPPSRPTPRPGPERPVVSTSPLPSRSSPRTWSTPPASSPPASSTSGPGPSTPPVATSRPGEQPARYPAGVRTAIDLADA